MERAGRDGEPGPSPAVAVPRPAAVPHASDGATELDSYDARMPDPPVPRPAATVVLLRPGRTGPEVLLTQRPSTMAFAADLHVFPGGAVDAADGDADVLARCRTRTGDTETDAALVAAVRELWEEAGVPLVAARRRAPARADIEAARTELLTGSATIVDVAVRLDLELRTDLLAPLSRWVTPPFVSRRFDVRFFVAELPQGVEPAFAPHEVVAHRWATPRTALDAMTAGEISLWVPTSATLQQLEHAASFDDVRERLAPGQSGHIQLEQVAPHVVRVGLPDAGGIAGQAVNAWVVGRRELVVVDPGDPSEAAADALLALAAGRHAELRAVAITHADPDHAAGAEALALRLGIPLFGGRGVACDLPAEIVELADGDPVPAGDLGLIAIATPGPRSDHTAFAVPDLSAVLIGDLVGPGPSRSILGPPDVPAWLASLDRIEALGARRLLPGHGPVPADPPAALDAQRRRLPAA
jgi:glyoxylase-like metal-dependent hydrolase (beta-lactamase superfamily II)/8-oxo-dGTP pyrophosphatase MutT (NUDIX family)